MRPRNVKKRLPAKKRLQSLPRISRPPKRLEEVLAVVELVPRIDFELPPFSALEKGTRITKALGWPDKPFEKPEEVSDIALWILMRGVGNPLLSYQAALWYKSLREIARGSRHGSIEALYRITLKDDFLSFELDRDPLIEGLNACGRKHDLRHLRECAVETCRKIFWAKKLPKVQLDDPQAKVGCSDKCKNILRVRKKRADPDYKRPQRPPARLEEVKRAIKGLCKERKWKQFRRTESNVRLLAEYAELKTETINRCLNYVQTEAG